VSSIDIGENRTHKTQCESDCKDCLCYGFHCRFPLLTTGSLSPARQLDVTNHTVRPWAQRTQNPAADQDGSPQAERRFIGTISADLYFDPRCGCPAAGLLVPAQAVVTNFLATFRDYPPRQKAASFNISQALEKMSQARGD